MVRLGLQEDLSTPLLLPNSDSKDDMDPLTERYAAAPLTQSSPDSEND
mgnify:CR=1 FL=1|jgi:hypothetical protein